MLIFDTIDGLSLSEDTTDGSYQTDTKYGAKELCHRNKASIKVKADRPKGRVQIEQIS